MAYDRSSTKAILGVLQADTYIALSAKIVALSTHIQGIGVQPQASAQFGQVICCEWYGDIHVIDQCLSHLESVNYYGNFDQNQNNLFSNTYNSGWKDHPNFGRGGNQSAQPRPQHHLDSKSMHRADRSNLLRRNYLQKKYSHNSCKLKSSSCKINSSSCRLKTADI